MALEPKTFSEAFTFTRARTASYEDAAGVTQTAAIDEPRFDHDGGDPLGLIVEGEPAGAPDVIRMRPGPWSAGGGTVLHDIDRGAGVEHVAWYATSAAGGVGSALRYAGRHRRLRFVQEFLAAADGAVTFDGTTYLLPAGPLDIGDGGTLDAGDGSLTVD